jgi:predicted Zn-dependent protease with MMP-like domain
MRRAIERHVESAFLALPEAWRKKLVNLAVVIEAWPEDDPDGEAEGEMLGMLDGPALTDQSFYDPYSYPTRLVLFTGPIADEADELGVDVGQVVRETVWHELAHYFGHDEDGAYALETKWEASWRQLTPPKL